MEYFFIATRGCNTTAQEWFQVPTESCVGDNSCTTGLAYTLNSSARYCQVCDYTCLECDKGALAQNCTKCDPVVYRVLASDACPCQTGYIDVGVTLCVPCEYYISGCSICLSSTVCTNCSAGFNLTASGICQCTSGFLVTGVCTTINGCINATNLLGTIYCQACNTTANYQLSGSTCICQSGYYFGVFGNCNSQCGDGIITSNENCDDANTASGDGCSSNCTIETNYACNNSNPSVCKISSDITGSVAYVYRLLD